MNLGNVLNEKSKIIWNTHFLSGKCSKTTKKNNSASKHKRITATGTKVRKVYKIQKQLFSVKQMVARG